MRKRLQGSQSHTWEEMLREYRWLSGYARHYKKEVLWYIFVGLLGTAISLVGSILSKHIIDAVTGLNTKGIITALVFFVLMQLFQILVRAVSGRISAQVSILSR